MAEVTSVGLAALLRDETIPAIEGIIIMLEQMLKNAEKRFIDNSSGLPVAAIVAISMVPKDGPVGVAENILGIRTRLDRNKLQEILQRFKEIESRYETTIQDSPQLRTEVLATIGTVLEKRPDLQSLKEDYVKLRLKTECFSFVKKFYNDEPVEVDQLRDGDHIYRTMIGKLPLGLSGAGMFHHGVFIGEDNGIPKIIDFGSDNDNYPVIRPLQDFSSNSRLLRRNYNGYDVPVADTIALARSIAEDRNWEYYSLFKNNCEHFATFLKLNVKWSTQASAVFKMLDKMTLNGASLNIHRLQEAVYHFKCVLELKKLILEYLQSFHNPRSEHQDLVTLTVA